MRKTGGPIRRRAYAVVAAFAVLLGVAGCTSSSGHRVGAIHAGSSDDRPNIVFVLTDDLSSDLVQYMPHLRALQQVGATFSKYFVVDSLCCPSRTAIFTGQYPHNDGVYTNVPPDGGYVAYKRNHDAAKNFAVALQRSGYRTGFMGKYINLYHPLTDPPARGWDEWDVTGSEGYPEYDYHLNENGKVHYYGKQPSDYLTDVLSDRATKFIDTSQQQGRPFALEVATFAPHSPYTPAHQDRDTFPSLRAPRGPTWDRTPTDSPAWLASFPPLAAPDVTHIDDVYRRRVASVQAVDRMIGRLEQELANKGLLKNTYFVFSSDNGFHTGQYRLLPGKQTAFDTDIRVPLIVSGPGVPAGKTITSLASSIDLAPTFTQIAGAAPADVPDGVSLLDLMHGQPAPPDWQQAVLVEHRGPDTSQSDPDVQVPRSGDPPSYEAMRTPTALYVEYDTGDREYYDLADDPLEMHNIVKRLPANELQALHDTLHALEVCRGPSCQVDARRV